MGIDFVDLAETPIDDSLLGLFPQRLLHRHTLFPVRRDNGTLFVATSDPFDLYPLDELSAATGLSVVPVLASRAEITKLIKSRLGVGSETVEGLLATADERVQLLDEIETDGSELSEMAQEASVVRLVNEILLEAIESRASDVHIESQAAGLVIRYRIDGILHLQPMPPEIHRFQAAIISRLKIMARLNIAEKRLPQDGRIQLKVAGREVDVRVSVIPMIHGEGVVMRLLDKGRMKFELQALGMEPGMYKTFHELIQLPHGIILVTGPTGSGKTTTLYSALVEIRDDTTKIITTEDPVEYQLAGINQIQVHPKIGLTFGALAAKHSAPRPGHRAGRRNPRPGDGRERDPGVADRPPGVQHAAHQRFGGRLYAHDRHGRGAVLDRQHGRGRDGPAAGADAVHAMPPTLYPLSRRTAGGFSVRPL